MSAKTLYGHILKFWVDINLGKRYSIPYRFMIRGAAAAIL